MQIVETEHDYCLIFAAMLPSEKTIGIIGGGQLGKMLIEAGQAWNLKYHTLDAANSPAAEISNSHLVGSLMDADKIKELAATSDIITYEIEHINIEALKEIEAGGKKVVPSSRILEIIQDKGLQKQFFLDNSIPTTPFRYIQQKEDWKKVLSELKGEKFAAKLRKGGYDGRGVELVEAKQLSSDYIPFEEPSVLEEFVPNAIEISVIVARNEQGETISFPPVEMEFDPVANLVEFLISPTSVSDEINSNAIQIAEKCILALQGEGIFAVEMLVNKEGEIFVNEIAPRPHNSGHHTIEACYTSQYEQLNRILAGIPLGSTEIIKPAAMLNILGAADVSGKYRMTGLEQILKMEGVYIHLYNKTETRPKRKMGHVTILGNSVQEVKDKVANVKKLLGMKQL